MSTHDKHKHDTTHDKHKHDTDALGQTHDSHGGVIPGSGSHSHTAVDSHDHKHDAKAAKGTHADIHKEGHEQQKHGVKIMPTPHDNKEVPGRHHAHVHSEETIVHGDHVTKVSHPQDVLNKTDADTHHTTYKDQHPITNYPAHSLSTVRQDHDVFKTNLERLLSMDAFSGHDRDAKQRLLNDTIALVTQHNIANEVVIYRAIRKIDKSLARAARNRTLDLEKLIFDIETDYGTQVDKPKFYDRFKVFDDLFMKHLIADEKEIIAVLEQKFTVENLDSINLWFDKVKKIAPTKPHSDGTRSIARKISAGEALPFVTQMKDKTKRFTI